MSFSAVYRAASIAESGACRGHVSPRDAGPALDPAQRIAELADLDGGKIDGGLEEGAFICFGVWVFFEAEGRNNTANPPCSPCTRRHPPTLRSAHNRTFGRPRRGAARTPAPARTASNRLCPQGRSTCFVLKTAILAFWGVIRGQHSSSSHPYAFKKCYLPAGQSRHVLLPERGWKVPALHSTHATCAVCGGCVREPGRHSVHAMAPRDSSAKEPGWQSSQAFMPLVLCDVPGGQSRQPVAREEGWYFPRSLKRKSQAKVNRTRKAKGKR